MTLQEKVRAAQNICGTHINLSDVAVTEIFGALGYDFLWVDMEHTTLSPEQVHFHLLAARAAGTPVIVRVPVHDLTVTKRILEMGPDGVVFPMVQNAADAEELLSWTLYPPYGGRGCGPKAAVRYGLDNEPQYYKEGHLKLTRLIQIETKTAAAEIEKIAAIPYLDGVVLGMHDLSGSINDLGNIFSEANLSMANRVIEVIRGAGKTVGVSTFATDEETLGRYHRMGINMISTGADYDYVLKGGIATLDRIRGIQQEQ